ncbi:MAG: hypothetical protein NVSMB27_01730 [Ktedonobacteraceae bacterium]
MQEKHIRRNRQQRFSIKKGLLFAALVLLLLGGFVSLFGLSTGDPRVRQQATQNRTTLERTIHYAQSTGVPDANLMTVLAQEHALDATHAPLALLNDQLVTTYYRNIAMRYQQLTVQTQGVIQVTTEQLAQQAQDDLQTLQYVLAARQHSNVPLATITQLYIQDKATLQMARYPKNYLAISKQIKDAITAINQIPDTLEKLQILHQIIQLMQNEHQDVFSLQKQYTDDQNAVAKVTTPHGLQQLNQLVDAQNQQAMATFTQAIPLLTQARVNELEHSIQLIKQAGLVTNDYQKRLDADQAQASYVKTLQDYLAFSKQVDNDLASLRQDLLKGQAIILVKQFDDEVNAWGSAHQYYDKYNGQSYPLDGGYMTKGIGEDLDRELSAATTADGYQQVITDTQNELFHLHLLEQDYTDKTPYTQVHATDQTLIDYYKLQQSKVIVVSFIEEALRVYDHGKLIRAFLITAGRPELPPVPGLWTPMWRLTNTTFKSPYPPDSPYWYPDTPIHYAILYHPGGYFLHDSWWRNDYGPGTQFYHIDSSGNASANYGTHGCVNMPPAQAQWVYDNTDYATQILMY